MFKIRNILIIIGIFFILKLVGQVMKGYRSKDEEIKDSKNREKLRKQKEFVEKNKGKTFVIPKDTKLNDSDIEDVDYQDVK